MKTETKQALQKVIEKLLSPDFSADDADWTAHLITLAIENESEGER